MKYLLKFVFLIIGICIIFFLGNMALETHPWANGLSTLSAILILAACFLMSDGKTGAEIEREEQMKDINKLNKKNQKRDNMNKMLVLILCLSIFSYTDISARGASCASHSSVHVSTSHVTESVHTTETPHVTEPSTSASEHIYSKTNIHEEEPELNTRTINNKMYYYVIHVNPTTNKSDTSVFEDKDTAQEKFDKYSGKSNINYIGEYALIFIVILLIVLLAAWYAAKISSDNN